MTLFLILAYLAVVLSPLALALAQGLPPRPIWDELATGAGMVALAIVLVEFVLSGRFRSVSRSIGMDITMRFHQLLARTALFLVFLHPLFYTTWNRIDAFDPARRGFVSIDAHGLVPGIVAYLLLGAIVAMAMLRSDLGYRYEIWRLLHGLGAVAMAWFGVLHATRLGRYSQADTLTWFWYGMFGIAVLSLVYVYVLKPLRQLVRPWRVSAVEPAAERMWLVSLSPEGHPGLKYDAGQFAWANFGHSPFSLAENPFSIVSSPTAGPQVSFLIKELGDTTNRIGALPPGTRAYLDAPHGHLTIKGVDAPGIALIAGGVGIAPMLGILREMQATGDTRPSVLVYGNRHTGQIACPYELTRLESELGTEIIHVLSEPEPGWTGRTGFPDRAMLQSVFDTPERHKWLYVLCGPPPMLDTVEDALIAIGIPARQILAERFVYE